MSKCKILSFGEVLWDIYPDKSVIGGAPFNFSAHAVMQGADVDLISAVGKDELADKTLAEIKNKGVGCEYVHVSQYDTGYCSVTLDNGIPSYNLVSPVAYDDIKLTDTEIKDIINSNYNYLYVGTLALRNKASFNTFRNLAKAFNGKIICDVNLRQHYYSKELLDYLFNVASVIKISREELSAVTEALNLSADYDIFAKELSKTKSNIELIVLTLDKDGAVVFDLRNSEIKSYYSQKPQSKVLSTVGAGDSFFGAFITSYFSGKSLSDCLNKAVNVSDYVVTRLEAIPDLPPELKN
ncbi:MAG: PfkB family carbohydrate kinase [Clostridia bacterium]|nr:PfkB family carbohydrate kinase [Clostridia bacterium]